MANLIYNSWARDVMKSIDMDTDTIKCMLVTSAYTPDKDAHTKRSDITNEITGTGYTAGGVALTGVGVGVDNTDNEGVFDADNTYWLAASFTARGAVLYKSRGGASSADELIGYWDFGSDLTVVSGVFQINWALEGIINLNN